MAYLSKSAWWLFKYTILFAKSLILGKALSAEYTAFFILLIVGTFSSIVKPALLASSNNARVTVLLNCSFAFSTTTDEPVSVSLDATALIF
ncbi:Uncharacterised protein [Staphylococcus aureus]|nr:Uncharacterised protein [Staphylococcus aureus]CAC6896160.1 Uncharacterised protein [Staphylococcus aureus]CAC7538602.1 Uncharacterised protein [Staphylococcus aureus]CAC7595893.1 Uncharacterised protein [Staphylococcus aureus]CPJ44837.1 Uncharacterised protein [Staphylococcus aureus]